MAGWSPWHERPRPSSQTPHLDRLVDAGDLLGYSVAVRSADGTTRLATRGVTDPRRRPAVEPSTSYRLASLSKPVAALLAAGLTAEGVLSPDDPIRRWVPELDGVRVLRDPAGPLDDTEPLARPITVHDLLTMTSGLGIRFDDTPLSRAMGEAGLHPGPVPPAVDDTTFLARLGELPLGFQPGAGWAYHTSTDVLSVVLARASACPSTCCSPTASPGRSTPRPCRSRPRLPRTGPPPTPTRASGWDADRARTGPQTRPCSLCRAGSGAPRRRPRGCSGSSSRPSVLPADAAAAVRTPAPHRGASSTAARPFVPEGYSFGTRSPSRP